MDYTFPKTLREAKGEIILLRGDVQSLEDRCERLEQLVRRAIPAIETFGGAKAPDWLADARAEVTRI